MVLDQNGRVLSGNAAAQNLFEMGQARLHRFRLGELLQLTNDLEADFPRICAQGLSVTERNVAIRIPVAERAEVDLTVSSFTPPDEDEGFLLAEIDGPSRAPRTHMDGHLKVQNQISGAILRGLGHEIKNPLGGIRGAAQLLERELEKPALTEYTQIIIAEADRLRNLVDRMLGPTSETRKKSINIHDPLEHVRQVVEAESGHQFKIVRDYDPSLPMISADRDQLIQALLNIVRNAVQSTTGADGAVLLRTRAQRKFTIGSTLHRVVIRAEVIDNGSGVDPEIAESIFVPLVSGRADGNGLGLPIAQTLVQRQGGLIDFDSEPGRTVFKIWLPVEELQ